MSVHYLLFSARETYSTIGIRTELDEYEWVSGARLQSPPAQLDFDCDEPAAFQWPDFLRPNCAIPLYSDAMREVLARAGVTNIEYVPATVTNLATGESRRYHAANIIGMIPAMDRLQSEFDPMERSPVVVRSVDRLVIDEAACAGQLMFRLAEYDLLVVIDEPVAQALLGGTLAGVRVMDPADWDGFAD
jgi:hypothetical protein